MLVTDINAREIAARFEANVTGFLLRVFNNQGDLVGETSVARGNDNQVTLTLTGLAEGEYQITVAAVDSQGNVVSQFAGSGSAGSSVTVSSNQFQAIAQPSGPSQLLLELPQTTVQVNSPFQVTVSLANAEGAVVGDATNSVTLSLSGALLNGNLSVNAQQGVAIFDGLTVDAAGTHQLTASSPGLPPRTVSLTVGSPVQNPVPTRLILSAPPSVEVDQNFQVAVTVADASGNKVQSNTNLVALSVSGGPGSIIGNTNLNATDGLASFTVNVNQPGTYTLTATSAGLQSTSATLTVASASVGLGKLYSVRQTSDSIIIDRYSIGALHNKVPFQVTIPKGRLSLESRVLGATLDRQRDILYVLATDGTFDYIVRFPRISGLGGVGSPIVHKYSSPSLEETAVCVDSITDSLFVLARETSLSATGDNLYSVLRFERTSQGLTQPPVFRLDVPVGSGQLTGLTASSDHLAVDFQKVTGPALKPDLSTDRYGTYVFGNASRREQWSNPLEFTAFADRGGPYSLRSELVVLPTGGVGESTLLTFHERLRPGSFFADILATPTQPDGFTFTPSRLSSSATEEFAFLPQGYLLFRMRDTTNTLAVQEFNFPGFTPIPHTTQLQAGEYILRHRLEFPPMVDLGR